MVKTTITLEDELYTRLVKEALERYGKTRTLSRIINEKLRAAEVEKVSEKHVRDILEQSFGSWRIQEKGSQYVRKLRRESEKRLGRLKI